MLFPEVISVLKTVPRCQWGERTGPLPTQSEVDVVVVVIVVAVLLVMVVYILCMFLFLKLTLMRYSTHVKVCWLGSQKNGFSDHDYSFLLIFTSTDTHSPSLFLPQLTPTLAHPG